MLALLCYPWRMLAKTFLAFDLGAESGRAISGAWDGATLAIEQLHRFPNRPVRVHSNLHWDILALQANIEDGLAAHAARHGSELASLGIDTWGVDFALLAADDTLAGLPHHYRDRRTTGMLDAAFGILSRDAIFDTDRRTVHRHQHTVSIVSDAPCQRFGAPISHNLIDDP